MPLLRSRCLSSAQHPGELTLLSQVVDSASNMRSPSGIPCQLGWPSPRRQWVGRICCHFLLCVLPASPVMIHLRLKGPGGGDRSKWRSVAHHVLLYAGSPFSILDPAAPGNRTGRPSV
jgi:hypothetical protein